MARAYPGDTFRAMSRAICFALVCGLAARAIASPLSDPTSGRAVWTGATVADSSSLELNPAALSNMPTDRLELYVAASAVLDHYSIARDHLDLGTSTLTRGPAISDIELGRGAVIGVTYNLKDRATLALQIHAIDQVFPSGVADWQYHTSGGGQSRYGGVVGGSIKVTDELSFGISLSVIEATYLRLHYSRDTAAAAGTDPARGVNSDCGGAPCGLENPLATERYDVDVSSSWFSTDGLRPNVGLVYQFSKDTFLGVAYHMPPGLAVQNVLTGFMTVRQAPRDGGGTIAARSTVNISQPSSVDAEFRTRLPRDLDLHVGLRWEDLSRLQAYDVRGYGPGFTAANLPEWTERPRGFHDPFSLWAGVEQVETHTLERLRLGARVGFETSAVNDEATNPLTIAPTSFTVDVGAQLQVTPGLYLQLSYGLQYFPPVHVTNSAFDPRDQIDCQMSGFDYSTPACAAARTGYAIATAAGDYDRMQHALRLALRYDR
jgi:long-subunit fatty acid transport protein